VSETPRTDEQINGKPCTRFAVLVGDSLHNAVVQSEIARQLERELHAANGNVERLAKSNLQLREGCEELKQRIKRLEEVLDRLYNLPNDCHCQLSNESLDAWNNAQKALQAKEAKL